MPSPGAFAPMEFLACGAGVDALEKAQAAITPDDICFILYTSGSTAAPKGVTLAHGPLLANGFDIGERQHLTTEDRLWLAVPLFWSFGSANAMPAIMTHGGCMVLQEALEPGAALALIERERCSVYYGMANTARALLEHPDHPGRRLGAMRTGLTIGPPEDITLTIQALGAAELCTVYGSTETYGNCAVTDAHDPLRAQACHAGPAAAGYDRPRRRSGDPGAAAARRDPASWRCAATPRPATSARWSSTPRRSTAAGSSPAISARSSRMAACASAAG